MKRQRHGRLFWKVYLHGVGLLALTAVALGIAGWLFGRTPAWRAYPERLEDYLSSRAGDLDRPEIVERDLRRERDLIGVEMTVYRVDGTQVATNVEPPIPPLEERDVRRLKRGPIHVRGRHAFAVPIRKDGVVVAYVASGGMPLAGPLTRGAAGLALILIVLALGSFPLARTILSPLERLTAAAQRLGSGDLTARAGLKRNDEVGKLAVAFDDMAERLEKLVRGEKELLANVSHELRTPLARIRVALELAAEGDLERARRYLSEIATDLGELERLVEDVLTAARLDLMGTRGGAPPLRRARVAAQSVLDAAAERFRVARPERTLEIRVEGMLPIIDADEAMLRRVVDNLLDNAAKYSDVEQPVVLAASAREGLTVEIIDQGIGIEAADLPDLFRPFFRTERSRSRGTGGIGMGLALARRIVEAHGGRISVTSEAGKGTTVHFQVPAATEQTG
ncbi:MAG: HAMP domain-containing histidine kinase [Deltaproteobacteria bacterium]|nr:HAMP domain-containing histidine kinase [Deltaproteobacteria bacterium]